jgi:hypothetical protein
MEVETMKKIIALLMTLALVVSAVALPALAEGDNDTVDQVTTATKQTGRGGPGGQQPPQMPGNGQQGGPNGQQPPQMPGNGQNNQGGPNGQQPPEMPGNGQNNQGGPNGQQPPEMPGNGQNNQGGPNGQQPPEMPGNGQNSQDSQDGQDSQEAPEMPGSDQNGQNDQNGPNGQKPEGGPGNGKQGGKKQPMGRPGQQAPGSEPEKRLDFEQLVKDSVITQEICDAILNYMKEHAPQDQQGTAPAAEDQAQDQQSGNAPVQGSEPPAKPEGDQNAPGGMEEQLLKELLDNSVITQEIYDQLLGMLTTTETTAETEAAGA